MMSVGMTRSNSPLQLMITSCLTGVSDATSGATTGVVVSTGASLTAAWRKPSRSRSKLVSRSMMVSGSATGAVMVSSSLPAQDEAVDAVRGGLLDELIAGAPAPRPEVRDRAGIGGQHFEQLARGDVLDGLGRLDDGHRALQAARVED